MLLMTEATSIALLVRVTGLPSQPPVWNPLPV
jgi:hypothetical protein